MAYTTIDNPGLYFNTILYTGDGSGATVSGVGFQPDLNITKQRSGTESHNIVDAVRGVTKTMYSVDTSSQDTYANGLSAFNSDGYVHGDHQGYATNTETYVSWNWKESATAGFDIVGYEGNGSARTISHSLSAVPKMIITKDYDASANWAVYHAGNTSAPETDWLIWNTTAATADNADIWNDTAPTSSVFSVGTDDDVNNSGNSFVTYLWSDVQGFSKFGVYTGNGNADGTFVYTGFRPAYVIIKRTDATNGWEIYDSKRVGYNTSNSNLRADTLAADDATYPRVDLHSNGFKIRASSTGVNTDDSPYVYMAFAEAPFVNSKGVPCNAR